MDEMTWKYVKELKNSAAVDDFEKVHGVVFPADLKAVLIKYNGGRPAKKYFDVGAEKDKEFKTLLSFNDADIENIYKYYPLDSADKTLIPFASDPAGNYFVLKNNAVHLWLHEADKTVFVAATFTEFLHMLHY